MLKALVPAAAILIIATDAQAVETPMQEMLLYSAARQTLLERGFIPYTMPDASSCDEDGPRCYPELLHCKQKRHWICDYTWRAGKVIYQLETHADIPMVDSFYCLINCGPSMDEAVEDRLDRARPLAQTAKSP